MFPSLPVRVNLRHTERGGLLRQNQAHQPRLLNDQVRGAGGPALQGQILFHKVRAIRFAMDL